MTNIDEVANSIYNHAKSGQNWQLISRAESHRIALGLKEDGHILNTAAPVPPEPMYLWKVTVRKWDGQYKESVVSKTPATFYGRDRDSVTDKVRAAFNAEFDSFRKKWSHDWVLLEVEEVLDSQRPLG